MQTFEIFTTRKSVHLQSEFRNYIWAKDKDGRYINTPEDHDNHCFTADTLILTNQGYKQIKDINIGDVVYNSDGWHRVSKTFDNGIQEVWKTIIELDDRTIEINSTPSHKFKTKEGWKQLQDLTEKDVLYIFRNSTDENISVCIVARHIKQSLLAIINSAQTLVKQGTDTILRWIMKKEPVNIVGRNSLLTNTSKKSIAQINAIGKIDEQKIKRINVVRKYKEHVYNMEVEGEHEYFANDILVSNCIDAARYYTLAVLLGKVMKPRNIDKKDLGVF